MKDNYNKSIQLQCSVCGSSSDFDCKDDNSYIKCTKCGKEYFGGYDELVDYNQALINDELEELKEEAVADIEKDIHKMFEDAFRGNKYLKIK